MIEGIFTEIGNGGIISEILLSKIENSNSEEEIKQKYFLTENDDLKKKIQQNIKNTTKKNKWNRQISFEVLRDLTYLGDPKAKRIFLNEFPTLFEQIKTDHTKKLLLDFYSDFLSEELYLKSVEQILPDSEFNNFKDLFFELGMIIKFHYNWQGKFPVWSEYYHPEELKKRIILTNLKLKKLPNTLKNIKNLYQLDLNDNFLEELPDWFGELNELRLLNLNNNKLRELPESINQLQKLTYAKFSFNRLKQVSEVFNHLNNLEMLFLSGNPFESIPKLRSFKYIALNYLDDNLLDQPSKTILKNVRRRRNYFKPYNNFSLIHEEDDQIMLDTLPITWDTKYKWDLLLYAYCRLGIPKFNPKIQPFFPKAVKYLYEKIKEESKNEIRFSDVEIYEKLDFEPIPENFFEYLEISCWYRSYYSFL